MFLSSTDGHFQEYLARVYLPLSALLMIRRTCRAGRNFIDVATSESRHSVQQRTTELLVCTWPSPFREGWHDAPLRRSFDRAATICVPLAGVVALEGGALALLRMAKGGLKLPPPTLLCKREAQAGDARLVLPLGVMLRRILRATTPGAEQHHLDDAALKAYMHAKEEPSIESVVADAYGGRLPTNLQKFLKDAVPPPCLDAFWTRLGAAVGCSANRPVMWLVYARVADLARSALPENDVPNPQRLLAAQVRRVDDAFVAALIRREDVPALRAVCKEVVRAAATADRHPTKGRPSARNVLAAAKKLPDATILKLFLATLSPRLGCSDATVEGWREQFKDAGPLVLGTGTRLHEYVAAGAGAKDLQAIVDVAPGAMKAMADKNEHYLIVQAALAATDERGKHEEAASGALPWILAQPHAPGLAKVTFAAALRRSEKTAREALARARQRGEPVKLVPGAAEDLLGSDALSHVIGTGKTDHVKCHRVFPEWCAMLRKHGLELTPHEETCKQGGRRHCYRFLRRVPAEESAGVCVDARGPPPLAH